VVPVPSGIPRAKEMLGPAPGLLGLDVDTLIGSSPQFSPLWVKYLSLPKLNIEYQRPWWLKLCWHMIISPSVPTRRLQYSFLSEYCMGVGEAGKTTVRGRVNLDNVGESEIRQHWGRGRPILRRGPSRVKIILNEKMLLLSLLCHPNRYTYF